MMPWPCRAHARARLTTVATTLVFAAAAIGCATLHGQPRAARAPPACVRVAVTGIAPDEATGDKRLHCLSTASVAQRCSTFEAILATYLKELGDMFGRGNAELADVRAGRAGIRCARAQRSPEQHAACCASHGF